jgi:hypothetical protein
MFCPDTKTFLMVRETVPDDGKKTYSPSVVEAQVGEETYDILEECTVDYYFDSENKGFEGGAYFSFSGERYMLGLCEGNHCSSGAKGKEPGNGMAILTRLTRDKKGECIWAFEKELHLPKEAAFTDYADLAIYYTHYDYGDVLTVGVVSQETAAVWIGELDTGKWEFVGPGTVYHFPRSDSCEIIFCNVEGISFLDSYQIIATSDRSKADQDYNCVANDQSVHTFLLPEVRCLQTTPCAHDCRVFACIPCLVLILPQCSPSRCHRRRGARSCESRRVFQATGLQRHGPLSRWGGGG